MMVKICGITNPEDALEATGGGASALGFIFHPKSPRFIAYQEAARIIETLPPGIVKVGVFVDLPAAEVAARAAETGLDVAQLHGSETAADFPAGVRVWKAFRVGPHGPLPDLAACPAEAVLLDGTASGQSFDWRLARVAGARVILAGGLNAANLREAIAQARPWGVDACSCLESSPGRKNRRAMREFLRVAAEAAYQTENQELIVW
jgi:phosphoribosylanthranilate isomerase